MFWLLWKKIPLAIDVPMLETSDRGYIVIDDRFNRSMNDFIYKCAQTTTSSKIQQLYLHKNIDSFVGWHPGIAVGCLTKLRKDLQRGTINSVLDCCNISTAASILATQTRRADLSGPDLQNIHLEVGSLLADQLIDSFPQHFTKTKHFPHVQGNDYVGKVPSADVVILPLMRGGEPMSRGVYERFPHGKLFHYYDENESVDRLSKLLLSTSVTDVIIVGSVVNEGNSVRNVIGHVQRLIASDSAVLPPKMYVLTAVMQKEAFVQLPIDYPLIRFIALRVSNNKYKGRGGTDTGNRLFGTFCTEEDEEIDEIRVDAKVGMNQAS